MSLLSIVSFICIIMAYQQFPALQEANGSSFVFATSTLLGVFGFSELALQPTTRGFVMDGVSAKRSACCTA